MCELRQLVGGETLARAEQRSAMQELVTIEKAAREKLEAKHDELREQHDLEKDARATHHASVAERFSYLEQLLKDSAEKHDEAMKAHHATLMEQLGELEGKLQ